MNDLKDIFEYINNVKEKDTFLGKLTAFNLKGGRKRFSNIKISEKIDINGRVSINFVLKRKLKLVRNSNVVDGKLELNTGYYSTYNEAYRELIISILEALNDEKV
jgi:hypothetical protein